MRNEFKNTDSFLSTHISPTTDPVNFSIPKDGRSVIVFDADINYLAESSNISDIFQGFSIEKVENILSADATDTQISDTLTQKKWKIIFVTADKGTDILTPQDNIAVVRFVNNNTFTATQLQTRLGLLWRLTQTINFKIFETWFNKDIRLGTKNAYYITDDVRSEIPNFYMPHKNSLEYKHWIS